MVHAGTCKLRLLLDDIWRVEVLDSGPASNVAQIKLDAHALETNGPTLLRGMPRRGH